MLCIFSACCKLQQAEKIYLVVPLIPEAVPAELPDRPCMVDSVGSGIILLSVPPLPAVPLLPVVPLASFVPLFPLLPVVSPSVLLPAVLPLAVVGVVVGAVVGAVVGVVVGAVVEGSVAVVAVGMVVVSVITLFLAFDLQPVRTQMTIARTQRILAEDFIVFPPNNACFKCSIP